MSEISTCKQQVDMKVFGPSHDKTFRGKKEKKPGSTVYVVREGKLVEKTPETVFVMALNPAGRINKNLDQFAEDLVMEMAVPAPLLHGNLDRSVSGRSAVAK